MKHTKRKILTLSAWLLSATLLNTSTACAANIAGYGSGGQGNIVALGNDAGREGVGSNYKIEARWTIAIGSGAHTYPKKHSGNNFWQTSPQEYYLRFGASNEALPGEIAIGNYTFARTGTIQIGSEWFTGTMGGITMTVNAASGTTNHSAPYSVVDTTVVGTNSYHSSVMGVMLGAYSITTGTADNRKNFASAVIGSLNSIRSASGSTTDGVASSVIGIANVAEKSNGTLIFGAGNKVSASSSNLSLSESSFSSYAGRTNVDSVTSAAATIVKNNQGGGAALVIGGGNEADYVRASQIFGTNNTMAGTGTSTNALSRWNSVTGTNNMLTSVSDTLVIGRNRTLTGVSHDIIIGATAAQTATSESRAGSYGHEANVLAPGGVALGYGSIADRAAFTAAAESATAPFSATVLGGTADEAVLTDGAVSIGGKVAAALPARTLQAAAANAETESGTLRQIINLADATQPTDAVSLRQLRGGLSFEVISGGSSAGNLTITDTAPKFEAGAGLTATVNEDTIVFALDPQDEIFAPEGALKGETGDAGPKGVPGPQGQQGPTGQTGDSGDAGPKGEKGDKGDPGSGGSGGTWNLQADGDAADKIKDGDTVQFISGSNAVIARAKTDVTIGLTGAPAFKGTVTARGFDAGGEKIMNLAPGAVSQSSTDAVNGSQLWGYSSGAAQALGGGSTVNPDGTITAPAYTVAGNSYSTAGDAFSALDRRLDRFRSETSALGDEIRGTSALNAALAGLKPIQFDPVEPSQIMFSVGTYRDKWAFALGMAHYVREDFMFHAGVAFGEDSRTLVKAGFSLKMGRDGEKDKKILGRYDRQPLTSVTLLRSENDSLHAQIGALERENAAAQARLETLERRLFGTRQ